MVSLWLPPALASCRACCTSTCCATCCVMPAMLVLQARPGALLAVRLPVVPCLACLRCRLTFDASRAFAPLLALLQYVVLSSLFLCCRLALEPSVAAQVSAIVSRVLRQCLLALTNHASAAAAAAAAHDVEAAGCGSSSCSGPLRACGYMCREVGGDMKYLLVFHRPRVSRGCALGSVFAAQIWPSA